MPRKRQNGGNKTFTIYTTGFATFLGRSEWRSALKKILELMPSEYTNINIIHYDPLASDNQQTYNKYPVYTNENPPNPNALRYFNELINNDMKLNRTKITSSYIIGTLPIDEINNRPDCFVYDNAHVFTIIGPSEVQLINYEPRNRYKGTFNIPVLHPFELEELDIILNNNMFPYFIIEPSGKVITFLDMFFYSELTTNIENPFEKFFQIGEEIRKEMSKKQQNLFKDKGINKPTNNIIRNRRLKHYEEFEKNWKSGGNTNTTIRKIAYDAAKKYLSSEMMNFEDIKNMLLEKYWSKYYNKVRNL